MKRCLFSALALMALAAPAWGHSWYTGTNNPQTGVSCCGGYDCAAITHSSVRVVPGGYRYIPTGEFIPHDSALASRDGGYHRCEFKVDTRNYEKGDTRCFFAPPMGF